MKVKKYNEEQLKKKIEHLKSMQGTSLEKSSDRRYVKAYEQQLRELVSNND